MCIKYDFLKLDYSVTMATEKENSKVMMEINAVKYICIY